MSGRDYCLVWTLRGLNLHSSSFGCWLDVRYILLLQMFLISGQYQNIFTQKEMQFCELAFWKFPSTAWGFRLFLWANASFWICGKSFLFFDKDFNAWTIGLVNDHLSASWAYVCLRSNILFDIVVKSWCFDNCFQMLKFALIFISRRMVSVSSKKFQKCVINLGTEI